MVSDPLKHAFAVHQLISRYNPQIDNHDEIRQLLYYGAEQEFEWIQTASDPESKIGGHLTPLHAACKAGNFELVQILVSDYAHPVNPVTEKGFTAAEIAQLQHEGDIGGQIYRFLKYECLRSEMLLNACTTREHKTEQQYMDGEVQYTNGTLIDGGKSGVMMDWETDLMLKHAIDVCHLTSVAIDCSPILDLVASCQGVLSKACINNLAMSQRACTEAILPKFIQQECQFTILNVGFGMGIIDSFIHYLLCLMADKAKSLGQDVKFCHCIIEGHPDVLHEMEKQGFFDSQDLVELKVYSGSWQSVASQLLSEGTLFNGIFFDTFSQDYKAFISFVEDLVMPLLQSDALGVFTFFNGFAATNSFFYDVYQDILDMDIQDFGFRCSSTEIKPLQEINWEGVCRPYYTIPTYRFLNYNL